MEVVSKLAEDSWQCVKGKQSLCDARERDVHTKIERYLNTKLETRTRNTGVLQRSQPGPT